VKRKNSKVVKINRSSKYSDRIVITFENKSVLRVPEDAFILHPILVGDFLSQKDIKKYDKKMRLQEARDAAYKLLSYRMRSTGEMRNRLDKKSFLPDEIDITIEQLKKLNYLNDNEFVKTFAKEKVKLKMIGPRLLRSELFKYYIETSLIDQAINEIYETNDVYLLIEKHLEKKGVSRGDILDNSKKKKLSDYLIRKGFSWVQINEVFSDWFQI
tara:strand:- start:5601 stop:6242 length:642 start_codon:yes stop_codon:yes gene_type:complete